MPLWSQGTNQQGREQAYRFRELFPNHIRIGVNMQEIEMLTGKKITNAGFLEPFSMVGYLAQPRYVGESLDPASI